MSKGIFVATMVMTGIAVALALLVYFRSPRQLVPSLKGGGSLLLQMLPLLLIAFIVAGLIPTALPGDAISIVLFIPVIGFIASLLGRIPGSSGA